MKTYITQTEALNRYKITSKELDDLLKTDRLDTVRLVTDNGEELVIYDDSLAAYVAERDITPEKFESLRGNLLGIGEAAREYKVGQGTISRWIKQGNLQVSGVDKNKKLINEADIAYLVALSQAKNVRPGKKVFS